MSTSDNFIDLHVFVIPSRFWSKETRTAYAKVTKKCISVGYIHVDRDSNLSLIRDIILNDLGEELIPRKFVFCKVVSGFFAIIANNQEEKMRAKNFSSPKAFPPDQLFLLQQESLSFYPDFDIKSEDNLSSKNNSRFDYNDDGGVDNNQRSNTNSEQTQSFGSNYSLEKHPVKYFNVTKPQSIPQSYSCDDLRFCDEKLAELTEKIQVQRQALFELERDQQLRIIELMADKKSDGLNDSEFEDLDEDVPRLIDLTIEAKEKSKKQIVYRLKKFKSIQNKIQAKRVLARDFWKQIYFDEKRKQGVLENKYESLKIELETCERKNLNQLRGNGDLKELVPSYELKKTLEKERSNINLSLLKLSIELKLRVQMCRENADLQREIDHKKYVAENYETIDKKEDLSKMIDLNESSGEIDLPSKSNASIKSRNFSKLYKKN